PCVLTVKRNLAFSRFQRRKRSALEAVSHSLRCFRRLIHALAMAWRSPVCSTWLKRIDTGLKLTRIGRNKHESWAVSFESNQAERWTRVQLSKLSIKVKAYRFNRRLDPFARFAKPSEASKWAGRLSFDVAFAHPNHLLDSRVVALLSE